MAVASVQVRVAPDQPADETIVQVAVEAAESLIFSRYRASEVRDIDIAVQFEAGDLEVDIYLNLPTGDDAEELADQAARAAVEAVDELLENDPTGA